MMTMLNALLFLLLLLAGSAAAFILEDLHRAEASACRALARLEAGAESGLAPAFAAARPAVRGAPRQPSAAAPEAASAAASAAAGTMLLARPARLAAFITLAGCPAAEGTAAPAPAPADAPRFDFALAAVARPAPRSGTQKDGQAVAGLPAAGHCQDLVSCA